jgi:hypothetical protein
MMALAASSAGKEASSLVKAGVLQQGNEDENKGCPKRGVILLRCYPRLTDVTLVKSEVAAVCIM